MQNELIEALEAELLRLVKTNFFKLKNITSFASNHWHNGYATALGDVSAFLSELKANQPTESEGA